jgi:hypothetical protein
VTNRNNNPYTEEYKAKLAEERSQAAISRAFGGKSRSEWIKERKAELVLDPNEADGDEFMAENKAEIEYDAKVKQIRTTEQVAVAKMAALYRSTVQRGEAIKQKKASAVAEANEAAMRSGLKESATFPGLFVDPNTGQYYRQTTNGLAPYQPTEDELQVLRSADEFQFIAPPFNIDTEVAEDLDTSPPPVDLRQFTKNIQAQLFNKMAEFNKDVFKIRCDQKIYRVPTDTGTTSGDNSGSGAFTQRLSTEGLFTRLGGGFLQATPAQLGSLMPLLRFYIVDQNGNQEEIYFSDIVSEQHIKDVANLKGKTVDEIVNFKTNRGGEAGIKSFTWNFNNKHEGDYIIEAQLELYFGSLVELANINYLRFLFPTGNDVDLAEDLSKQAKKRRANKTGKQTRNQGEILKKLKADIDAYDKVLSDGNKSLKSLITKKNDQITSTTKSNFRQLKVVVGWSIPEGSTAQLESIYGKDNFKKFKEDIEKTHTAILLNLYDYNVNFSQEGPTTLSLSYLGSTDNYLAKDSSDIFGSNNLNPSALNDFMYKDTKVSLEGILEENNLVSDALGAASKKVTTTEQGGVNVNKLGDPYLSALYADVKRREGGEPKNIYGQRYVVAQLAGLKLASELISMKLKYEEAKNKDQDSNMIKNLRRSGQYVVILYQRALKTRLRDMYSTFIKQMIDNAVVRVGYAETNKDKPLLNLNPNSIARRQEIEDVLSKANQKLGGKLADTARQPGILGTIAASILEDSKKVTPPKNNEFRSVKFYYFFLGDILQTMMKNADLRDDITLILGNFEDVNGNLRSIYNIPISLDSFAKFFFDNVVSRQKTVYPFRRFMEDFLNFTAKMMNQNTQTSERISFDYTTVFSTGRDLPCEQMNNNTLRSEDILKIRSGTRDPLSKKNLKYEAYYAVFVKKTSFGKRTGSAKDDLKDGIFHYVVGSDRGLAKKFNFSRQETQYFQEMLIESNNPEDRIQALFLPQNVNIEMYGNGLHRNGDLIYVDTRAALGDFAGQILGIGGYYRVIRSTHQITNTGYNTTLDCVFELRAGNKKNAQTG